MTTPPSLPTLAGIGWSVKKTPTWSTIVASHVSGREVRSQQYVNPLYEFEVNYTGGLASNSAFPGIGTNSLQTLLGFFNQMGGQFGTFLYADPTDSVVTAQAQGIGDGTTLSFAVGRTIGGFSEPVGWVTTLSAVYLNGVAQSGGAYSLSGANTLLFVSAPGVGVAITADFTFSFVCRFTVDKIEYEQIMSNLWIVSSVTFRSVKP